MKLVRKNKKGFTLIELVVVIAILAILALILIPSISGYVGKANDSRDQANARTLYTAAVLAVETLPEASDGAAVQTEALKLANLTGSSATVTITGTGSTKAVSKVLYGGWEFDGTTFTKQP